MDTVEKKPLGKLYFLRLSVFTLLVFVMLVDTMPSCHLLHEKAVDVISPGLDKAGLWQGNWTLFAPEAPRSNFCLFATVYTRDGKTYDWHSPDVREESFWGKLRVTRWVAYFESIREDRGELAWPYLARWIEQHSGAVPEGSDILRIVIWNCWDELTLETLDEDGTFPYKSREVFYRKLYVPE